MVNQEYKLGQDQWQIASPKRHFLAAERVKTADFRNKRSDGLTSSEMITNLFSKSGAYRRKDPLSFLGFSDCAAWVRETVFLQRIRSSGAFNRIKIWFVVYSVGIELPEHLVSGIKT